MKKAFGILVPLILWAPLLFAQVKFTATASKTSVGVGERFEVNFHINANADKFTPPDLRAFQVLYGPNTSINQVVNNNGDTTFDITYSCILVAKKEGTFDIDAAAILVNAQNLLSNSLKINVKGQFPTGQQQQFNVTDPFAAEDSLQSTPVDATTLSKLIFIRAETDKTHAYVGEQIKVTYKLYTRVNITSGQLGKAPALKGFRNHDVANSNGQNNPLTTENVNGMQYKVIMIKQLMVSPEHAGDLTIAPLTMATILQIPKKGTFDNPSGNYHQLKYELKSAPVIIHAIALRSK
ncbi:BatD family protein [Mucilaginibacter sp. X5P1]|uniref:BatD family protein n=1 Tax=Mucilaginibacter sp. X5P1 TaxID=2723088 RepID=UPI0016098598|nr:BatD family protein [Mucilaginibacter sp. X5P1]MBB6138782.1 hypothetical protein [Mucilaginibacter sp. X5P1]